MRGWSFVALLMLAACTTESHERGLMGTWNKEDSSAPPPAPSKSTSSEPPKGKVVEIPRDVAAQMGDFVNRWSTIYADAVEIDLSRDGWLALATFAIAPDAIDRQDTEDADQGLLTISLSRRRDVPATKDSVPTVRFGDGLRVVGVDRILLRFSSKKSVERPFWFHAVGAGKTAIYRIDSEPPQEWRGKSVDVRNDVRLVNGAWRFDWSAEAKP
jgi:hypothetical protein